MFTILAAPVQAQSSSDDELRALIDELNTLLDKGEQERLADPWYLRDLRDLVSRYDWPWRQRLLSDDFSGQGPEPGPPWKVTAGEFLIDWRHGLRSVIKTRPAAAAQQQQQESSQPSEQDLAKAVIGTLLQQAIGGSQQKSQGGQAAQEPAAAEATFAAVAAQTPISNAFALEAELTARPITGQSGGRLEIGPYQGTAAVAGYRLVHSPGAAPGAPSIELLRLSANGTSSTLELYDQPIDLADGQAHTLVWTRDKAGAMVVSLDGTELFRVTDRGFRDPFDGLAIINAGGDFAFRRIVVDGAG